MTAADLCTCPAQLQPHRRMSGCPDTWTLNSRHGQWLRDWQARREAKK